MTLQNSSLGRIDLQQPVKLTNHVVPSARVIVRAKDMRNLTGIPNSTRADKEDPKSPRFDPTWPKKIKLGARSVGYFLDEVLAWLEKCRKELAT